MGIHFVTVQATDKSQQQLTSNHTDPFCNCHSVTNWVVQNVSTVYSKKFFWKFLEKLE